VHEPETPPVTANWQLRGHPYDALNKTTAVEDQGKGTVESGQRGGQAISYAMANEGQCQLRAAQAEAAVANIELDAMKQEYAVREAAAEELAAEAERWHRAEVDDVWADVSAMRTAAEAAAAAAYVQCAVLLSKHQAELAAVDARGQSTLSKLQGDYSGAAN